MMTLATIARLECVSAARLRWIRLLAAACTLIATAAAYSAGAAAELTGADGFARTTMTLVPVAIILVPLAAMILGVSGHTGDGEGEPFLFAQPVHRAIILVGRWAGQVVALSAAVSVGFGAGAAIVAFNNGVEGLAQYVFFVCAAAMLGAIFLSLAAVISAVTGKRATALAAGVFTWFTLVLLYDGVALAAAAWTGSRAGGRILFGSVLANPADLVRILMLSVSGTPHVLGAAGEAWTRFLGGGPSAAVIASVSLVLWTAAPLAVAARVINHRDL
jgi:Cu-processing system permease protein